jgi:hypothetical protein
MGQSGQLGTFGLEDSNSCRKSGLEGRTATQQKVAKRTVGRYSLEIKTCSYPFKPLVLDVLHLTVAVGDSLKTSHALPFSDPLFPSRSVALLADCV